MSNKKYFIKCIVFMIIVSFLISNPYTQIKAEGSEYSSDTISAFTISIKELGYGINVKAARTEHLSGNSCDVYFENGEIKITNGGRIEKIPLSSLSAESIEQAFSPYNMKIQLSAEKDTVYVVYSQQKCAAAFLLTSIDKDNNIYQGIGVSTIFDNRTQLAEALKYQIDNPPVSDVKEDTESANKTDVNSESTQEQTSDISKTSSNEIVDICEKEITINLKGIEKGINLQSGNTEPVSSKLTDFFIKDGRIICLNGARVNKISINNINDNTISQALAIDQLENEITVSTDEIYVIMSPRGCLGVILLTEINKTSNIYKGTALSSPLDNALKRHIIETTSAGGMDTIESGDMDVIETGEMDVISTGGYDYFDTEMYSDIRKVNFRGKKAKFQVPPRKYDDGEVLILLKDIAPLFGINVTSTVKDGIETAILKKGNKIVSIEAYSNSVQVGSKTITIARTPKMDSKGILVPLSFLADIFSIHFSISEDSNSVTLSKKQIVEWRYSGYKNVKPYKEYETMYIDGVKTSKTKYNGKNHKFKNVTLYNIKTNEKIVVSEDKVHLYKDNWSTTPPAKGGTNDFTSPNNAFFTKMNTNNFFKSSTFNTWGGNIIRSIVP